MVEPNAVLYEHTEDGFTDIVELTLPQSIPELAPTQEWRTVWDSALDEIRSAADATGTAAQPYVALWVAAVRGREAETLDLIQTAISRTGAPPTRAEIASKLGFKSANAAEEHLQALARKGVIELVSGTSRGIRLRSDALRSLNESRIKQFSLPLQSLAQLALPLVGRVAAGVPASGRLADLAVAEEAAAKVRELFAAGDVDVVTLYFSK